jgi:hypothetical protein
MTQQAECRGCGQALPSDAPEALCPACLLGAGLDAARGAETTGAPGGFIPPPADELGRLIPGLEVSGLIGRGGMGAVYRARQVNLDRPVALKVLPPALAADPLFAHRFEREAKEIARLTHQHIVSVYDFGCSGDVFYIVMELVEGPTLRQLLAAGELTAERAVHLGVQVCSALQYAAEEGVVHRDIKPENILLDAKGRVKIADFGLAKLLGPRRATGMSLTGTSMTLGTPVYMAPEQVSSADVDHRADIYSAGVVLYEMLTGKLPLGHFAPPSSRPGLDRRADALMARALAHDPRKRYQQAGEMQDDLERIRRVLMVPDYQVLGTRISRATVRRTLGLASECAAFAAALAVLIPLFTGVRIGWRSLMEPVTAFDGLGPLFGAFWWTYFAVMLVLAAPLLLFRRRFHTWLPLTAACLLVIGVVGSVAFRITANPRINVFSLPGATGMVRYDAGNRLLVGMRNGQIYAYDPLAGSTAGQVDGDQGSARYFDNNRDGSRLVVSDDVGGVLQLLDPVENTPISVVRGTAKARVQGAFSPDGSRLAMLISARFDRGGSDAKARDPDSYLWIVSAKDGAVLSRERTPPMHGRWDAIDWSGDLVAVAECYDTNGRGAMLYDVAAHKVRFNLVHPEHQSGPLSVKLSPDARILAVGYAPVGHADGSVAAQAGGTHQLGRVPRLFPRRPHARLRRRRLERAAVGRRHGTTTSQIRDGQR